MNIHVERTSAHFDRSIEPSQFELAKAVYWLRQLFPVQTTNNVAAMIGVSPGIVHNYLQLINQPSADTYARMVSVFGPEFMVASMSQPPTWLRRAVLDERTVQLEAAKAAIEAAINSR